ncbi:transporter [Formosa sp. Hel1_31_208]|uniref:transporter n=1 Tax=Formosa sp. Hel1_31_208 TaxID=1798225 RepID=UPI000B89120D|nr:transporter [Formosa sp. Hel1_31_208]
MKTKNLNLLSFFFLFCSTALFAQNDNNQETPSEPLVTDRPDATESPTTIVPGFIQVETGGAYESFKDNIIKFETYTYNTTLVRLGLLDNLELRLGWNFTEGRNSINSNLWSDVTSGFSPLLLGTKIAVTEEKGWRPQIGVLGHVYLPFTAGEDYKPETTGVDFIFAFAHTLSERSSLGYNLGARWQDDSPEASYIYSMSYGYSLTDTLGTYIEIYGNVPENSKANHLWDAGLTYLISNNVQLDATVGSGITADQDLLLSAGVSFRLPTK